VSPSSTSSSDRPRGRLPLAGVLALLVLLAIEWSCYGSVAVWEEPAGRIPGRAMHPAGTARARLALDRAAELGHGQPFSFVIGSSRALYGYAPEHLPGEEHPPENVFEIVHPQLYCYEMLAYAHELAGLRPSEVVLLVSEFDTHRPLELMTGSASASLGALAFLIKELPVETRIDEHVSLSRLGLEAVLESYRYRRILGVAGADDLRIFDLGPGRSSAGRGHLVRVLGPGPVMSPSRAEVESIVEVLGGGNARVGNRAYFKSHHLVKPISRGEHARVQMALLRRAIAVLREAGITVIVVETPLSPLAALLYDTTTRRDFLDFAQTLQRDYGIDFVSLDPANPYLQSDFGELVHLAPAGARRMTRTVDRALRVARERRAAKSSP
jgi:hypothetical protein